MGDYRAEVHIVFILNGEKFKCDMDYINWWPMPGVDHRVEEFFEQSCQKVLEGYRSVEDRKLYERLKKKYEKED